MRSKTVIVLRWKETEKIEVLINLGSVYMKYTPQDLGVSRFTLDRKELFDGYENEKVQIIKFQPQ